MTTDPKLRKRGKLKVALLITIAAVVGLFAFVKLNPLIFNESFLGHAHCITQAGLALRFYANEHGGHYPTHTNGFGDAILPLIGTADAHPFTGPMFDASELLAAKATGRDVDESKLGRIYVQPCDCDHVRSTGHSRRGSLSRAGPAILNGWPGDFVA
jgi:hypothetical protein